MSSNHIDDATALRRAQGVMAAPVRDRLLMMQLETERYFLLSPVTARIWDLLESPCVVADIVTRLVAEYEVTPELCRAEVIEVLRGLAQQEMIEVNTQLPNQANCVSVANVEFAASGHAEKL